MLNFLAKVRITPKAGPQQTIDLAALTHLTRAQPFYEPIQIEREFVNRSVDDAHVGWRVSALLEIVVPIAPHPDLDTLTDIVSALADDEQTVELSMGLDEVGAELYRVVGRFQETVPEYVEGVVQTVRHGWTLTMRDLIDRPPQFGQGAIARW